MQNTLAVAQSFIEAWISQDAQQVMNHFTDESEIYVNPAFPGTPPEYHGKEQVQMFVNGFIVGFGGEVTNLTADGNRATFSARLSSDAVKASGIDTVDQNDEVVVVDDKVKTFTINFTPETIEKFNKLNPRQASSS